MKSFSYVCVNLCFMKKNFYPVCLTIVFSLLILFMYYRVSNLEYKYETLKEANIRLTTNNPLTESQIKERQFKEDMYISQQENDTNLILVVFTVVLGMTAFLTFTSVERTFERHVSSIDKKNTDYTNNIDRENSLLGKKLIKLEKDLSLQTAKDYSRIAEKYYDNGDLGEYILACIFCLNKYVFVFNNSSSDSEHFKEEVRLNIHSKIDDLFDSITHDDDSSGYIVSTLDFTESINMISEIVKKLQPEEIRKFN